MDINDIKISFLLIMSLLLNSTTGSNAMSSHELIKMSSPEQVKDSRRSIAKTIKTKYGDIYDCVDFYEQPALRHPLLKNNDFHPEMKPSFRPNWITANNLTMDIKASNIQLLKVGCPSGTVPLRRISEEDRIQVELLSENITSSRLHSKNPVPSVPGSYFAIVQTKSNPGTTIYKGVGATLSVWNPPIKYFQYSSSQISIRNGLDSIQAGWTVNPILYKDNLTRMFIYTKAGQLHCFNTYCPGFVIVRSDIPPDSPMENYSKEGGPIFVSTFFISQDSANGNWWLEIRDSDDGIYPIGFWPKKIFSDLAESGSYVECGGETYSSPDQPGGGPPMGTGSYVSRSLAFDAFCIKFSIVNENHKVADVDNNVETFVNSDKYEVQDIGIKDRIGHAVVFGGPGGT